MERDKAYFEAYSVGINSCNGWKDYKNPHDKGTKEYNSYYEGFCNALDDLWQSWGSTGCD